MKAKDVIPGVFSRHAAAYRDRVMHDLGRGRQRVVNVIGAQPGERVLDMACGPGTLTLRLAGAVGPEGRVVAVDLAEGMLDLLRRAAPANVEVRRMDIERLDFPEGSFDAVVCGHGLQFCPEPARAVAEARRVLVAEGGRFGASLPGGSAQPPPPVIEEAFASLPPRPRIPERERNAELLRDPDRLRSLLLEAGFSDARVEAVEEPVTYADAADLVTQTTRWWECAWRLEQVPEAARPAIAEEATGRIREALGEGPITTYGRTLVLLATS